MSKVLEALQKVEEMKQRKQNKAQARAVVKLMDEYVPADWSKCKDDAERQARRQVYNARHRLLFGAEDNEKRRQRYASDPEYRERVLKQARERQKRFKQRKKEGIYDSTGSI